MALNVLRQLTVCRFVMIFQPNNWMEFHFSQLNPEKKITPSKNGNFAIRFFRLCSSWFLCSFIRFLFNKNRSVLMEIYATICISVWRMNIFVFGFFTELHSFFFPHCHFIPLREMFLAYDKNHSSTLRRLLKMQDGLRLAKLVHPQNATPHNKLEYGGNRWEMHCWSHRCGMHFYAACGEISIHFENCSFIYFKNRRRMKKLKVFDAHFLWNISCAK